MKFITWNIGGGLHEYFKLSAIENLLIDEEPTILTIIESDLRRNDEIPNILPLDYEVHYENKNKRRLLSYIKRGSGFIPVTGRSFDIPVHLFQGRQMTVAAIYSQFTKYDEYDNKLEDYYNNDEKRIKLLSNTIKEINGVSKRMLYIAGDMNVNWNESGNPDADIYKRTVATLKLKQQIHRITHPKRGLMKHGTVIDHILSRNMEGNFYVHHTAISDHHAVGYANPNYKRIRNERIIKTKNVKYTKELKKYAQETNPFDKHYQYNQYEKTVSDLTKYMQTIQEKATSYKFRKPSTKPWWKPWLLKYKTEFERNPDSHEKAKKYRKKLRLAHRLYDEEQKNKKNNPFRTKPRTDIGKIVLDGKVLTSDEDKANALAEGFDKKVQDIINTSKPNYRKSVKDFKKFNQDRGITKWNLRPPKRNEVMKLLKSLPNKTSHGKDCLPYTLAKFLKEEITTPIHKIFQFTFDEERVLDEWLSVIITAVYKKGSPEDRSNYRPVALGNLILRLIEKWLANELTRISKEQPLLPEDLHGFNAGKSTETCLNALKDYSEEQLKKGKKVALLLLDATAAFDAIPRGLIISVLDALGCGKSTLNIFKSYLGAPWEMRVKVGDTLSKPFYAREGVIQGGGASANLYCFTSSIVHYLLKDHGRVFFYADDSCMVVTGRTDEELQENIEKSINIICDTFQDLGLTINQKKSELLPLKGVEFPEGTTFAVKDFKCKPSTSIKFLGAMVQTDLKADEHVNLILSKLQGATYNIRKESYNRTNNEKVAMIHAFIQSHVSYARDHWLRSSTKQQRQKIQSKVDAIIKEILNKKRFHYNGRNRDTRMKSQKLRAKYRIKSTEMMYEDHLIRESGKVFANSTSFDDGKRLKYQLRTERSDSKHRTLLKKIWNKLPISYLVMSSKIEKRKLDIKNWLKKVYYRIFEAEYKLGELPRPPDSTDGTNQVLPLKWRFDTAGMLDPNLHQIYQRLAIITYQCENFIGFDNPRKTLRS